MKCTGFSQFWAWTTWMTSQSSLFFNCFQTVINTQPNCFSVASLLIAAQSSLDRLVRFAKILAYLLTSSLDHNAHTSITVCLKQTEWTSGISHFHHLSIPYFIRSSYSCGRGKPNSGSRSEPIQKYWSRPNLSGPADQWQSTLSALQKR